MAAAPNMPHDILDQWLWGVLRAYRLAHPDVINYVSAGARVFVPGYEEHETTCPQPDLAAYHGIPFDQSIDDLNWRHFHPLLVVEILSPDNTSKDLIRNIRLYEQVPEIKEYWIVDPRESADRPSLIVYRRRGRGWQKPIHVPYRGTYTTKLLPGFQLVIDPHAK